MEKTVAFIPVRGGSKSIPKKNIKELCGRPLVYWTAKAACEAELIDEVYVATDSDEIRLAVEEFCNSERDLFSKLKVIGRSKENASDVASTESVMLEFAQDFDFTNIVLVQATSPLLRGEDLDGGMRIFNEPGTDSVISLVQQKRFLWKYDGEAVISSNYDFKNRPRRQDFDGYLMENGAFYITSREALLESKNRLSGCVRAYLMPEETAIEIDEVTDFLIVEKLLQNRLKEQKTGNKSKIKMIVVDCDGCLTDGGMYYSENGDELKKFNTKDGMALRMAMEKGLVAGIITGEDRELNARRAKKLGLNFIKQGIKDKSEALLEVCREFDISLENVLFIGDDVNDIDAMRISGMSACPLDASAKVIEVADYVSTKRGGHGAVREIIECFLVD